MKKSTRNILIVSLVLILVGGVLAGTGWALGGARSVALTSSGPVVNNPANLIQVDEHYSKITSIDFDVDVMELHLQPGEEFALSGSYYDNNGALEITESNGKLSVQLNRNTYGTSILNFNWGLGFNGIGEYNSQTLTLTYPANSKFTSVILNSDYGDIEISGLNANSLSLDMDAGSFIGENIKVDSLDAYLDFGDFTINNLDVTNTATLELNSGQLSSDDGGITVGELEATLDLGDIDIDELTVKNSGNLTLSAGALNINKVEANDLSIFADMGSVEVKGKLTGTSIFEVRMGSCSLEMDQSAERIAFEIVTDMGSIDINGRDY
ncbi:MAG: DUF4097 domain-containing protein, partial [Coriobacteriales bacterium]|nr:DUF4097 domain-containing protein [Coriobacteriales bacterium]